MNLDDTLSLDGPRQLHRHRPAAARLAAPGGPRPLHPGDRRRYEAGDPGRCACDPRRGRPGRWVRSGGVARVGHPGAHLSRLLGLPVDDEPALRAWLQAVTRRTPDEERLPPAARAAGEELRAYFTEHVARRRRAASDDLLGDIVAAERRGALSPTRSRGCASCSTWRGPRRWRDFVGNALVAWPSTPSSATLLAAEPGAHAGRRRGADCASSRRCSTRSARRRRQPSCTASPSRREARSRSWWGAANRDERRWSAPTSSTHPTARRNLAFGEGIHHCLGAPLARLQGRVILLETLRAMPGYRPRGEPERIATHNTRGRHPAADRCRPDRPRRTPRPTLTGQSID